jgi:transcriptional regulator with XRE-family HTH domain
LLMCKAQDVQKMFGNRVRELRQEREMSQETLAFDAGMDRTYVNSVEMGRRNISLVNIVRIAKALGVEPNELLVTSAAKARKR